jgi:hypothetical protein
LRPFPKRLFVAALAVVGGYAAASLLAPGRRQGGPPGSSGPATAPASRSAGAEPLPADGDALVKRVLDNIERRPNVAAKVRQFTRLEDETLAGTGVYWQQGVENLRRTYMRLQSMAGDEPASYMQVFTGQELWLDRRVRDERKVSRVDVGRIVRDLNLAESGGWSQPRREASTSSVALVRGGASQLVAELHRCFEFAPPQQTRFDGVPALAMVGRWRSEELARTWPGLETGNGAWPAHLPQHVLLVVGAADLFPRLVEYRRGSQASLAESGSAPALSADPLARFEFYEVNFVSAMRDEAFEFAAVDIDWRDITTRVIERLRSRGKLAAKDGVRRQ